MGHRKEIGEKIRTERKYRKLTLEECAKILGISGSFLGLVERGERCLSLSKIITFCSVFGIHADYLLYGDSTFREEFASIKDDIIFELEGMTEKDYNILLAMIKAYKISKENHFPYRLRTNQG